MKCPKCDSELMPGERCSCDQPTTERSTRPMSTLIEKVVSRRSNRRVEHKNKPGIYIECFPFPPIRLTKHNEIQIGRGPENDLILTSNDVSRRHAAIKWCEEKNCYIVRDLNSHNGVTVNNELVEEQELKNNDIIKIGANDISFYELVDQTEKAMKSSSFLKTVGTKADATELLENFRDTLRGSLGILELSSVLQMIAGEEKSGHISLQEEEDLASIFFVNGMVVHSELNGMEGADAFYKIMEWRVGNFEFIPDETSAKTTMSHDLQFLLMEAARRIDEDNR
ncbi:DUF4388 domain-containing protein [Candidatus Uabimicrobium amorphum]|uniref:PATAN domain GTPase-activating protein n=1 Tax=Uabimicrobium amorphum TaxID=2596890 RepID=A0A5S9ING2_UABAM|nr:DUF4388 domain-containing protein [Candidatus Uabimicrobium amorphum]BBM85133.1 PATAN domain GTPase-activating protein [Candidatus Uabimicrobium amorphum]